MELLVPIALVLAGLGLIVVEVYLVPGVNVVGIVGALTLLFGVGYAFSEAGMTGGLLTAAGAAAASGGAFYAMWKTGAWNAFILGTSLQTDRVLAEQTLATRTALVGRRGTTVSPLRPTGFADIDGERVEVVTEGHFVAAGVPVEIVAVDRRRVFVREAG
jgi:membrane-bound serine protease (ClpP class)